MKLRAVNTVQTEKGSYGPGTEFEVTDQEAKDLIESGAATEAKETGIKAVGPNDPKNFPPEEKQGKKEPEKHGSK